MKSSDFSADDINRCVDRANALTGRDRQDGDAQLAQLHIDDPKQNNHWGDVVRATAREIFAGRAKASSMAELGKLFDEGTLMVPPGQTFQWVSINEPSGRAVEIPGLIVGVDFQARP